MRTFTKSFSLMLAGTAGLLAATPADAALTVFQTYNGSYGLSTDGGGSTASSYGISAFVPVGATVAAAYLYQANLDTAGNKAVSLNGKALTFSPAVYNASYSPLSSSRSDVTSIVSAIVNGGAGGTYNFSVVEGNSAATDGTALVVVYSLASLPSQTVAILDGFSATGGDSTMLNFAVPIDPAAAGFKAEMRLGIGFSAVDQSSTVSVNGTTITNNAGDNDDGAVANGALITVGGDNDAFSPLLPTYAQDHERYNIVPYLRTGDTSITVRTNNPSGDDNIFLAAFVVSGDAGVNAPPPTSGVPEPTTWAMMLFGFGSMGYVMRRKSAGARIRFA